VDAQEEEKNSRAGAILASICVALFFPFLASYFPMPKYPPTTPVFLTNYALFAIAWVGGVLGGLAGVKLVERGYSRDRAKVGKLLVWFLVLGPLMFIAGALEARLNSRFPIVVPLMAILLGSSTITPVTLDGGKE
jgi:peptidoglycan/LPS O-acetylase OafA/YrhL